jgi:1,4-alpha-glucan branching enzyme
MKTLPMSILGPHLNGSVVNFGILLPGITPDKFRLEVKVIHEKDQFIQTEQAYSQLLHHSVNADYGDYWYTEVDLNKHGSGKNWGKKGKYLYRYCIFPLNGSEIDWIIDPYAREFGKGKHAAFTYGYTKYNWSASEANWQTPAHHDLIMYELNLIEFEGSLLKAIDRLDYLNDLGVNCISLMPVTNVNEPIDWGYTPIGYFGVDERFGNRFDFQNFVDHAHQKGIAVVVDAIYGHTSHLFGYKYLYDNVGVDNPFMGSFSQDMFSPSVNWAVPIAQDFFYTVNLHWLETYHVDGFRYDCVPNYWELGPDFRGYASISYYTYQYVKSQIASNNNLYTRFADAQNPIRLIQCAEQLEAVKDVLEQTYSTSCWQNSTKSAAEDVAHAKDGALKGLGNALGAAGLPTEVTVNNDRVFKSPLQYIETHDHNRFICNFGTVNTDANQNTLFDQGDRTNWYKLQPYLTGILLSKGIPLIWQGQELCENYMVASCGCSRVGFLRNVRWEYFYDKPGKGIISLVRKLLKLRKSMKHLCDGEHFFFNDDQYSNAGVLLYCRYYPNTSQYTLVALNFTSSDKTVPFWFPLSGNYEECLHGSVENSLNLFGITAYQKTDLVIPSNYARIWNHINA